MEDLIDGTESVKDLMSQHVEENLRLATREYVVLDGPREGLKITTVLRPTAGVSSGSFYGYWFGTHAHKVKAAMERACGEGRCRYSISVGAHQATHPAQPQLIDWCVLVAALDPERAAYGGVAELWFPGAAEREAFASDFEDEPWLRIRDTEDYHSFVGSELVAIP